MSVTYIALNLLLQNERESKKMESGSVEEKVKRRVTALSLRMQLLHILVVVKPN